MNSVYRLGKVYMLPYVNLLLKEGLFPWKIECLVNHGIYCLGDSHGKVDKWTNEC